MFLGWIEGTDDISFSVNGPALIFGSATKACVAGKVAAVLRTTKTPGSVRVIASRAGLIPDTVVLTTTAVDTSGVTGASLPGSVAARSGVWAPRVAITSLGGRTRFRSLEAANVNLLDLRGRTVQSYHVKGSGATMLLRSAPSGCYIVDMKAAGRQHSAMAVLLEMTKPPEAERPEARSQSLDMAREPRPVRICDLTGTKMVRSPQV